MNKIEIKIIPQPVNNIINNYISKQLYGGFILKKYKYGYDPNYEYNPILIIIDVNKQNILNKLISYCKHEIKFKKVCGIKFICIGIYICKLEIGEIIKQIEWNDCQGYFCDSIELDRKINIDK